MLALEGFGHLSDPFLRWRARGAEVTVQPAGRASRRTRTPGPRTASWCTPTGLGPRPQSSRRRGGRCRSARRRRVGPPPPQVVVEVGGLVEAVAPEQAAVALGAGLEDPHPQVEVLLSCLSVAL